MDLAGHVAFRRHGTKQSCFNVETWLDRTQRNNCSRQIPDDRACHGDRQGSRCNSRSNSQGWLLRCSSVCICLRHLLVFSLNRLIEWWPPVYHPGISLATTKSWKYVTSTQSNALLIPSKSKIAVEARSVDDHAQITTMKPSSSVSVVRKCTCNVSNSNCKWIACS